MYAFDKDTFFWSGEIENAFTHVVWNSAVTVLALNFRVTFYRCSTPSFGVFIFTACLASYAASWRLPHLGCLPKSRASHCPWNIILRGLLLLWRKNRTAVSLNRTPKYALFCWTSSNSSFDQAPDSPPPYGWSQGSGSTDSPSFSCGPCRRPTRSLCGPLWVISGPTSPPEIRTPFCCLWSVYA